MLGSYYFPPILMAFRHRFPDLTLTVVDAGAGELKQRLAAGELDLAVIVDELTPDSLQAEVFLREQMMVVCAKDHPFAERPSIDHAEFFAEELVMFNRGFFHRNVVDRLSASTGLPPKISFETNLIPLIKSIVKQGFAISTLMAMVIRDEPELIARPFTEPVWLDLSIAWRKGGYLSQANRTFVEFVLEESRKSRR